MPPSGIINQSIGSKEDPVKTMTINMSHVVSGSCGAPGWVRRVSKVASASRRVSLLQADVDEQGRDG